jgi:guanylate kinase
MSDEEFDAALRDGAFYEHVVYVSGHRYGTLKGEIDRILGAARSCVLEVETQGARAVKQRDARAVTIFIASPSFEELERRLTERATESAGEIGERLALARRQMDEASDFDVVVVNDSVERAADEIVAIADRQMRDG